MASDPVIPLPGIKSNDLTNSLQNTVLHLTQPSPRQRANQGLRGELFPTRDTGPLLQAHWPIP